MDKIQKPLDLRLDSRRSDIRPLTTTSASRDPRLASSQQSSPPSSILPPPPPPPPPSVAQDAKQASSYGLAFVEALGQYTTDIAAFTTTEHEYRQLKKKCDAIGDYHTKAKNMAAFPTAMALFTQSSKQKNGELARIEEKLEEYQRHRKIMEQTLTALLNTHSNGRSDEKLNEIQTDTKKSLMMSEHSKNDVEEMKDEVKKLKMSHDIFRPHVERLASVEGKLDGLEHRAEDSSSLAQQHSQDISRLNSQFAERIRSSSEQQTSLATTREQLDKLEKALATVKSDVQAIPEMRRQCELLEKRLSDTNTDLEQFKFSSINSTSNIDERFSLMEKSAASAVATVCGHVGTLEQEFKLGKPSKEMRHDMADYAAKLELEINGIEGRLRNLETMISTGPVQLDVRSLQHLKAQVDDLNWSSKKFLELQEYKDDTQMKAMEVMDGKLREYMELVKRTRNDCDAASRQLKDSTESRAAELEKQVKDQNQVFAGLKESVEQRTNRMNAVETAIVSLELRYNHITTGPLVHQVLSGMQEIYPSVQQLKEMAEQLNSVRSKVASIPILTGLSARLENVTQLHNSLVEEVRQNHLNYQSLSDESKSSHAQLLSQQQRIDDVIQRQMYLANEVRPLQEGDRQTLQEIDQERHRVISQVMSLNEKMEQMSFQTGEKFKALDEKASAEPAELAHMRQKLSELERSIEAVNQKLENAPSELQEMQEQVREVKASTKALFEKINIEPTDLQRMDEQIRDIQQSISAMHEQISTEPPQRQIMQELLEESVNSQLQDVLRTVEDVKAMNVNEIQEALRRLDELEQAKEVIIERLTQATFKPTSSISDPSQPTIKVESSQMQVPDTGSDLRMESTPSRSAFDVGEVAKRAVSSRNKRKHDRLESEDASVSGASNSGRSTPVMQEGSPHSQKRKKKHKKKHRPPGTLINKPSDIIEIDD